MSQMQFHDMYREATDRRHRDAEDWARSRSLRRDAHSARAHFSQRPNGRMRVMAVASPMVALLALLATGVLG